MIYTASPRLRGEKTLQWSCLQVGQGALGISTRAVVGLLMVQLPVAHPVLCHWIETCLWSVISALSGLMSP